MKTRWMLDQLERDNEFQLDRMRHDRCLAVMSSPVYTPESREKHLEDSFRLIRRSQRLLSPWYNWEETRTEQHIHNLRQLWVTAYGDPQDPKVAAKIKKTADWLMGNDSPAT